jgi:hypothetical protein
LGELKMKRYIDLHTHTEYSDGIDVSPKQLVRLASTKGLDVLAISDHDNERGYFEAADEAERLGLLLIPGTEISTHKYHLLGLNFNPYDEGIKKVLAYGRECQRRNSQEKIDLLCGLGIPITMEKMKQEFPYSRLGSMNVFMTMVRDRECREVLRKKHPGAGFEDFWKIYFGKPNGLTRSVGEKFAIDVPDAIHAVHNAGGLIGLAHPPKDIKQMSELDLLVEQGIDFLEVQPQFRDKYPYDKFEQYALENGLPISYGSDYHGPVMKRELLGRGDNVLSEELESMLNKGWLKICKEVYS